MEKKRKKNSKLKEIKQKRTTKVNKKASRRIDFFTQFKNKNFRGKNGESNQRKSG